MSGPNLALMAWRNLWRHRLRTVITLVGISFGLMLAGLFTGMSDWRWASTIDWAASMGGGHISVQHPEMLETPSLKYSLADASRLEKIVTAEPDVRAVVTRIRGQVMLATAAQNIGSTFVAIDPNNESKQTLAVFDSISEGEMFESSSDKGIILGVRLAEKLDTKLGRKVVYTLTDKSGEIVTGLARVSGLVETGAPTLDATLCLLPLDAAREVLGYGPDEASTLGVFLHDQRDTEVAAARLDNAVGASVVALPWSEVQPDLASFINMKIGGLQIMGIFMMLFIGAGIFITIFVSVTERLREFGILMAIGFSPGRLFRLVIWESTWLGIVGVVVGAIITAPLHHLLNVNPIDLSGAIGEEGMEVAGAAMEPILRVNIYPENAVLLCVVVLLATIAAGLYPAWKAGRVVPVDSIKLV